MKRSEKIPKNTGSGLKRTGSTTQVVGGGWRGGGWWGGGWGICFSLNPPHTHWRVNIAVCQLWPDHIAEGKMSIAVQLAD